MGAGVGRASQPLPYTLTLTKCVVHSSYGVGPQKFCKSRNSDRSLSYIWLCIQIDSMPAPFYGDVVKNVVKTKRSIPTNYKQNIDEAAGNRIEQCEPTGNFHQQITILNHPEIGLDWGDYNALIGPPGAVNLFQAGTFASEGRQMVALLTEALYIGCVWPWLDGKNHDFYP